MKIFHCNSCDQLVHFENIQCLNCGSKLAYLQDARTMASLSPGDNGIWATMDGSLSYKLCRNYAESNVCNWAIPEADTNDFCMCCQLNRVIPDLSVQGNAEAWAKLEVAKRRLVYSLSMLGLPLVSKAIDPQRGLAFDFLADDYVGPVLTGHEDGVITLNIAEADDAEREKRRVIMGEPYRTLLGHFRHEVGHYYWDLLVQDSARIEEFRRVFGDERQDYGEALKNHYANGAPANWQASFISSYATSHPWEDWAESWAHYLHMSDAIETAASCGISMTPSRPNEPSLAMPASIAGQPFERLMECWFPLTYILNNLNRGLGLADGYPFVISAPAVEKLRFVHDTIAN